MKHFVPIVAGLLSYAYLEENMKYLVLKLTACFEYNELWLDEISVRYGVSL